jgi:hypothetical protein
MHASSSHGAELTDRCDTSSSELHESVLDLQQYRALLNQQQAVRPAIRFSNLASIEVQSIMHFLDAGSIITLVLYSDADTGFAWKHLTPDCLCECEEFPLSSMGLQHCVLDLTEMDGCEPSSSIWDTQLYHQLTGLMISESTSRPFTRYLLQQHKFLASVRTLTLDLNHTSSRAFFKIVVGCVRLPSLTSVDVKNHSDWDQLNVRKACIKLHPNIGTLELHQMSASRSVKTAR